MEDTESNYKIIADPDAFRDFIDWLPVLTEEEQYYCCLFSRKKYAPNGGKDHPWIKSDKDQLKRFTSKKEYLYSKVWQCEAPYGAYAYPSGNPVFREAIAIYINANPRNLWKTNMQAIKKLLTVIESQGKNSNPHQEVMSIIQQTASEKHTILFDIDSKEIELKELIDISSGNCDIIETRGGYHVHVRSALIPEIKNKMWYLDYKKLSDVAGDEMSPMVGCFQGGFVPRFVYRHDKVI